MPKCTAVLPFEKARIQAQRQFARVTVRVSTELFDVLVDACSCLASTGLKGF